jgi:hypothetical protein
VIHKFRFTCLWLLIAVFVWSIVMTAGLPVFSRSFRQRDGFEGLPELYWVGDHGWLIGGALLAVVGALGAFGLLPGTKRR